MCNANSEKLPKLHAHSEQSNRATFQTLAIDQWERLDCPNGPQRLYIEIRTTSPVAGDMAAYGGKEMGRSQKIGWRVKGDPLRGSQPTSPNFRR